MAQIEELVLTYDAAGPMAAVARGKRLVRGRIIGLGVTVVVMALFYVWQRQLFSTAVYVIYAIALLVGLGLLVFRLVALRQARRTLAAVQPGLIAVRIGRGGVQVGPVGAAWPDVAGLRAVSGGLGKSPVLRMQTAAGAVGDVPLDQINTFPATLDSAARAYSAGRVGVDLSALDT